MGASPSATAQAVLEERYLRRSESGSVVETFDGMAERVARHVAAAEELYRRGGEDHFAAEFAEAMRRLEFLPGPTTLRNAGTGVGMLAGSAVLPVEDSLRSIFSALSDAALVYQAGGAVGFSLSHLRPDGDRVSSTGGLAAGPMSWLRLLDASADIVASRGRLPGSSLAVLDASHPDIVELVAAASSSTVQTGAVKLMVGLPDSLLRAAQRNGLFRLVTPRTGDVVGTVRAAELLEAIYDSVLATGQPGIVFLDALNRSNPMPDLGRIEAVDPYAEIPLLPYETCNLGALNLVRFIRGRGIDWDRLRHVVAMAVRFLDDAVDVSSYPVPAMERAAHNSRKVGLGVMGLASLSEALGVEYGSERALQLAGRVARHVEASAREASAKLARERGAFLGFERSVHADVRRPSGGRARWPRLRNAALTAIWPTGDVSLLAGTSPGIEAWPDPAGPFLPSAWPVRLQAVMQRSVDAGVSTTVPLEEGATAGDVRSIVLSAWRAKAKGISVLPRSVSARLGSLPGETRQAREAREAEPSLHARARAAAQPRSRRAPSRVA